MESSLNGVPKIIVHSDIVIRPGKPESSYDCVENSLDSLFHELFDDVDIENVQCNTQTIFEKAEQTDFLGINDNSQSSHTDNYLSELLSGQEDNDNKIVDENTLIRLFNDSDCDLDMTDDENSSSSLEIDSPLTIFSSNSNHSKIDEVVVISDSEREDDSLAIQNLNVNYNNRIVLDPKFDLISQPPLSTELHMSDDSEDIPCGQKINVHNQNFLRLDHISTQVSEIGSQVFSDFDCDSCFNDELPISDNNKIDEGLTISDSDNEDDFLAKENLNVNYNNRIVLDPKFDLISQTPLSAELDMSEDSEDIPCGQKINTPNQNFLGLNDISTQSSEIGNHVFSRFDYTFKFDDELPISDSDDEVSAAIPNFDFSNFNNPSSKLIHKHTQTNVLSTNSIHTQTNKNTEIASTQFTQTPHKNTHLSPISSNLNNIFLAKNKTKITEKNLKSVSRFKSLGHKLNHFYSKLKKHDHRLEGVDEDWERIGACFKDIVENI